MIHGGNGNDTIRGEFDNDSVFGDAGDDLIVGGFGDDVLDGGAGVDTLSYEDAGLGVTISLGVIAPQKTGGYGTIGRIRKPQGILGCR